MKHEARRLLLHFAVVFCMALAAAAPGAQAADAKKITAAQGKKSTRAVALTKTTRIVKKPVLSKPQKRGAAAQRRGMGYSPPFAALVVDAEKGQILYEVNAGEERHPASLTKMMTLYLLFDQLKKKRIGLETLLPVSAKAAAAPPTNISLTEGDRITVKTAIESIVVRSANDAAMVVAEALGGSQSGFADMMNAKARQLGMSGTHFFNPSGLPDERQVSTAYDLARLGIALRRDFAEYYPYFNITEFRFRGKRYEGHNRLLGRYPGADGIKTGFIGASGFNLVTSVKRGGWRLVGVIMGGHTAASRDQQMMDMLDSTFAGLASGKG